MWRSLSIGQRMAWAAIVWLWSIPLLMGLLILLDVQFSTNSPVFMVFVVYALPAFLVEMLVGRAQPVLTIVLYLLLVAGLTWFVWRKARKVV